MGDYEVLEHTADVGVRARGASLEECFEQATLGLLDITGTLRPSSGEAVTIEVDADDLGALLVYWLEEVLYLQDARDAVIGHVRLDSVDGGRARGSITIADRGDAALEGTAVKAITYHQLDVARADAGWVAQVYFDI